jgi:hypothetical protein
MKEEVNNVGKKDGGEKQDAVEEKEVVTEKPKVTTPPVSRMPLKEYCIVKGIMEKWHCALIIYVRKANLNFPHTFEEWEKIFTTFKEMPVKEA